LLLRRSNFLGGERTPSLSPEDRRKTAARLLPAIRFRIASAKRKVGHFTDAPEGLEFVNSRELERVAPFGTSCPNHFPPTKIRPLIAPADADDASSKSTGDIIDVDAGNAVSFTR
jgi:rhamnose utilization protein RhaD (predicted bifunctional aldolase and dehydrogenase)